MMCEHKFQTVRILKYVAKNNVSRYVDLQEGWGISGTHLRRIRRSYPQFDRALTAAFEFYRWFDEELRRNNGDVG